MAGGKRRPHRTPIRPRHVSTIKPVVARKSWNSTSYAYTAEEVDPSRPIHLASSSTVAFVDPNPNLESTPVPTYTYDTAIIGELGLGSPDEEEEEETAPEVSYNYDPATVGGLGLGYHEEEEEEDEEEESGGGGGGGFISIGGVRVYTEDTSSPEDDETGSESEDSDEDDDGSDGSSSSSGESDGSEIDDELAKDYIEMIGGSEELMKSGWLAKNKLDGAMSISSDDDDDGGRLAAVEMMSASAMYGMKKKKSKRGKSQSGSPMVDIGLSAAMDDLMFVKDPRSGRRKGRKEMKALSQLSRSWPREGQRSKEYYGVAGGRKKHRKEVIAIKRRERMNNRGVDLDEINLKLRQIVLNDVDMFSFQPMHSRDCSQVQRLATIYRFRSGCQNAGKKRFVTVTRTSQTCLPSPYDKQRLDKLLGEGVREVFPASCEPKIRSSKHSKSKSKTERKLLLHQSAPAKLTKNGEASGRKKRYEKQSASGYSERPVAFISSGKMEEDSTHKTPILDSTQKTPVLNSNEQKTNPSSTKVGSFEVHTKGFGSKMMAKMGYVEGSGLGKDGQGMAHALEGVQRPKSLGLGMQFDEVAEDNITATKEKKPLREKKANRAESSSSATVGAFEKHTTGFGSKMMARMGFIHGGGLGRNAQGMVTPLTAVRRPKARGLGAES